MKIFCNVCLGNYMQNVSIIDNKGLVKIEKVTTPDLPIFLAKLNGIEEVTLKGPSAYIKKVQKDTEYQVGESKPIKFILQS